MGFGMTSDAHGATLPASGTAVHGIKQPYHLVDPSPWPIIGAAGAGMTVLGIVLAAHFHNFILLAIGLITVLGVMFLWWRDVIRESRTPGMHSAIVRLGMRYGMTLFIASEVMFFVGFFWAYFNFALFPDNLANPLKAVWPPEGTITFNPFHLPLLNTMILLLSGTTVTWAHHGLLHGDQKALKNGLILTVLLGMTFTMCQAIEYSDAPFKFSGGGVYSSVFSSPPAFTASMSLWARSSCWSAGSAPAPASSPPSGISASKRRPGIGTSSMSCGCSCSSASICWAPARSRPISAADRREGIGAAATPRP